MFEKEFAFSLLKIHKYVNHLHQYRQNEDNERFILKNHKDILKMLQLHDYENHL